MTMVCPVQRFCRWRLALSLALQILFSTAPLSHAKGGGLGGGGGHGHGGRRRNPPRYKRSMPPDEPAWMWLRKHLNPLGHHNVPRLREVVGVLVDRRARIYVDGNVTAVEENGWFVVAVHTSDVHHDNHTSDVHHDNQQTYRSLQHIDIVHHADHNVDEKEDADEPSVLYFRIQASSNFLEWLCLGLFVFLSWFGNLHLKAHEREARAFDAAFAKELSSPTPTTNPPVSGSYMGFTSESDCSDQRVDVELEFGGGGLISGQGNDSKDGRYTLKGAYSGTRVKWIETYYDNNKPIQFCTFREQQPLQVTVRGTYKGGRRFVCFFRSSRGVTGTVTLGLKKKVVEAPQGEDDELRRRKPCQPESLGETSNNARGSGSLNKEYA